MLTFWIFQVLDFSLERKLIYTVETSCLILICTISGVYPIRPYEKVSFVIRLVKEKEKNTTKKSFNNNKNYFVLNIVMKVKISIEKQNIVE